MSIKHLLFLTLGVFTTSVTVSQKLKLESFMKGEGFVGTSPQNLAWSIDNNSVLFDWNPNLEMGTSRYAYNRLSQQVLKVPHDKNHWYWNPEFNYSQPRFERYYFNDNGNLARYEVKTHNKTIVYAGSENIGNVFRTADASAVFVEIGGNLFRYDETLGSLLQITNFVQGKAPAAETDTTFLERQQRALFPYIQLQDEKKTWQKKQGVERSFPRPVYYEKTENLQRLQVSKNGRYITFVLHSEPNDVLTNFETFITDDGYTQRQFARTKVSDNDPSERLGIYDCQKDTCYFVSFGSLRDIRKKAAYFAQYGDTNKLFQHDRNLAIHTPVMHQDGKRALIDLRSYDNKDRWIVLLNLADGTIRELEHQHDEAWIGGPGISGWNDENGTLGWIDAQTCYFQSEESGYSHLYSLNTTNGSKKALTSGKWEVYETILSQDNKCFYLIANKIHPGVRNGYQLNLTDGKLIPLFEGNFGIEWALSPDGKTWAIRYSTATHPWELYLAPNKPEARMTQVTHSTTKAFDSLALQIPEIIQIPTSDHQLAYGRIYRPAQSNGAAILFVHGAGYLQNAHYYWSYYQREMLFHQLMCEQGYTIIDLDYRASEGYGRNWRTDIYRHMGERDLNDFMDAKKYLVEQLHIDSNRVGIYGGSYGGFITLMAMLKTPDTFACGAALRSVTDWAHYNHEYTSNILNYPGTDPLAYQRSSPIYFAEGQRSPLLLLHGMVDDNVQFQDIIRLNQRFIELGKTNYQLSVFPTEAHGFTYTPAWVDEYRRIYELFETHLRK